MQITTQSGHRSQVVRFDFWVDNTQHHTDQTRPVQVRGGISDLLFGQTETRKDRSDTDKQAAHDISVARGPHQTPVGLVLKTNNHRRIQLPYFGH